MLFRDDDIVNIFCYFATISVLNLYSFLLFMVAGITLLLVAILSRLVIFYYISLCRHTPFDDVREV